MQKRFLKRGFQKGFLKRGFRKCFFRTFSRKRFFRICLFEKTLKRVVLEVEMNVFFEVYTQSWKARNFLV